MESLSSLDDELAAENGRLWAAQAIADNPEQKERVERMLGVAYCKFRWPEAYGLKPFGLGLVESLTWKL